MAAGSVYLVGAGPGDPGLLTLRGRQCLRRADVVVYDALINPRLLEHAPSAEHIYVGKKADRHSLPQEDIQALLIAQAKNGRTVVRLKGGDPFVFGRGGEEALALATAGIHFEVVPGITAGIAATAYAGIPVTHRGKSTHVTFVTGHLSGEEKQLDLDFRRFDPQGTLVFYMGVGALGKIVAELTEKGWQADVPCAVIEWGTYARQRTVAAPLERIESAVKEAQLGAPAIIVIGTVAGLREELAWFEARPLFGLRVAITHAQQDEDTLEQRLRALGADVFRCPTVEIQPEAEPEGVTDLDRYDWLVLTSANAARTVFHALDHLGKDGRYLGRVKICAVGASTLTALEGRYLLPDVVPENYTGDAIVSGMKSHGAIAGQRVLIPRADVARASLAGALEAEGAHVTESVAYHMEVPEEARQATAELLHFSPHLLVFTNAAAVRNLCELLPDADRVQLATECKVASIGPVTTRAAQDRDFEVVAEPDRHDVVHLVEAICGWAQKIGPER